MNSLGKYLITLTLAAGLGATPALAIDFGDDSSEYANDGECDDPRFSGENMAADLLSSDIMKDATDCVVAFQEGTIIYGAPTSYGDDSSPRAHNGVCDDPRYRGLGVSRNVLTEADTMRDATDCWQADMAGRIQLADGQAAPVAADDTASNDTMAAPKEEETTTLAYGDVDFGDDSSAFSNDGECDDPRFEGDGMTATELLESDKLGDATDCREAFEAGTITLK